MKVLNLTDSEKSEIKYKISKFPDGQQNVTILGRHYSWDKSGKLHLDMAGLPNGIQISSRLNNWSDLELIVATTASLREMGVKRIFLYVPYFVGARSDRKFEEGGNNYLKDVICPIINSLNFKTVTCIDPHSDVLEACINNFKKIFNLELFKWATREIYGVISEKGPNSTYPCIFISPDAGASKKIYKLAEQIGYKGDIITCSKDRDKEGKLTKTVVPVKDTGPLCKKDYIIIDDICDGGATFINIAQELKKLYNCNHIYLIVTHGIFSKGFDELSKYFDGIYCTNSYKNVPDFEWDGDKTDIPTKVKQLDVFKCED